MTITRLHMSVTVLIALALHGGIAMWLALPTPAPLPELPAQSLRVSLLTAVEETTVNAPVAIAEPLPLEPILEPMLESTPAPPPRPIPEPVVQEALPEPLPTQPQPVKSIPESVQTPEPVVQEATPEPQPPVKPKPEPLLTEPQPVKSISEPVQTPEPIQEIAPPSPPMESNSAPLDAAAITQYRQLLRAWLEKHKIYPRHAQRLRIEGGGMLRILIDRTGRIQRVALEKRTGNSLLDKAALEMARRADPFPPIPENDSRRELEFIIPVVFSLR